jgi:pimeloyl-ACP methyl ester carboxylesterase
MNYGYYLKYRSILLGKPQGDVPFDPPCPMLFLYGRKKPTMFHSDAFVVRLDRTPGSRAVGFDAGHWLMLEKPDEVAAETREWLRVDGEDFGSVAGGEKSSRIAETGTGSHGT